MKSIDSTNLDKNAEDEKVLLAHTDIEKGEKFDVSVVKGWYPFVAFLLIGTAELFGYNSYLNSSFSAFTILFRQDVIPTITVCYFTLNCVITIIAIVFPVFFVRPLMTYLGLILTLIDAVLYPAATYAKPSVCFPLLHLMGCFMGISSAVIGASGFGYANYFQTNYGSVMSAGLGVAGILSFGVWLLVSMGIFTQSTPEHFHAANWCLQGVSIIISMSTLVFSIKFFRDPNVKLVVNKHKIEREERTRKKLAGEKTEEEESILEAFKASWSLVLMLFWTMFVTLFCFPNLGPLRWGASRTSTDILLGLYQLGDLIGRFSPNFVPFLMLSKTGILVTGALRTLLIATFIISKELYYTGSANNMIFHAFQMLALSITNGLVNTSTFFRAPSYVRTSIGKARCSAIALLAVMIGLTLGQWGSVAYLAVFQYPKLG